MEIILLSKEQYELILSKLNSIESNFLNTNVKENKDELLDNSDLLKFLKITSRTAQNYRDKGLIPFSKIGSKIFYKKSDVIEFIDKHRIK